VFTINITVKHNPVIKTRTQNIVDNILNIFIYFLVNFFNITQIKGITGIKIYNITKIQIEKYKLYKRLSSQNIYIIRMKLYTIASPCKIK
jgi:hypothetical protein